MTIPITVLTGFLGSGKTTLLSHAFRGPLLARCLVLVNELGSMPLDHHLVNDVCSDVLLLRSGCVCCSVLNDLPKLLLREVECGTRSRFNRIILETTGIADPTPILATLIGDSQVARHYHIQGVITCVDAEVGAQTLARHEEARKQVLLADSLVVTKLDRVSCGALREVRAAVDELNPSARVLWAERGLLDWRPLLQVERSAAASRLNATGHQLPHLGSPVRTFTVRSHLNSDLRRFARWLNTVSTSHRGTVLRVKGLLRTDPKPGPLMVQVVQQVVYPGYALRRWPSEDESSRVVVITRGIPSPLVKSLEANLRHVLGIA